MGRFLNKEQLTIIILVILLFDLNGFADMSLRGMIHADISYTIFLLSLVFLIFDTYVYHYINTLYELPDVDYSVNYVTETNDCNAFVKDITDQSNQTITNAKNLCLTPNTSIQSVISEKMVLNTIAAVLVMCVIVGTVKSDSKYRSQIKYTLPLMLVAASYLGFSNFLL